jgi:hypothetical protein
MTSIVGENYDRRLSIFLEVFSGSSSMHICHSIFIEQIKLV